MTNSIQLKIPMTYDEQILNLQVNHGLVITDCAKAKEILKTVNYYRLSAYGIDLLDKTTDRYREGTSLEQIYSLYQFDSRLRNIISPVIEYVEIKLRSHIAYHLALKYGAECYRDRSYFHPWASGVTGKDMFDAFNEHVDAEIKKQSKKTDGCSPYAKIRRAFSYLGCGGTSFAWNIIYSVFAHETRGSKGDSAGLQDWFCLCQKLVCCSCRDSQYLCSLWQTVQHASRLACKAIPERKSVCKFETLYRLSCTQVCHARRKYLEYFRFESSSNH